MNNVIQIDDYIKRLKVEVAKFPSWVTSNRARRAVRYLMGPKNLHKINARAGVKI